MVDLWEAEICAVALSSLMCRSLMWASVARRARSGGESAFVAELSEGWGSFAWTAAAAAAASRRSGDGWPERERRISWSMLSPSF
jgi:hypothetical protein